MMKYNKIEKIIIFICILTSILPLLDTTIISVILGDIANYFFISKKDISWITTIYLISTAFMIPTTPILSKKYSILTIWLFALIGFALGSFICGFANNYYLFLFGRMIQGMATGLLIPLVQIILVSVFPKENLRLIMAYVGIPAAFIPAISPLLGSIISTYFNWQWVFIINIPIILLTIIIGYKFIKKDKQTTSQIKYNIFDLLFICIGYTLILLYLNNLHSFNNNQTLFFILFIIGLILVYLGIKKLINNKNPSISLIGFKSYGYTLAIFSSFIVGSIFFGFFILYPIIKSSQPINNSIIYIGIMLCIQGIGSFIARSFMKNEKIKKLNSLFLISIGLFIASIGTFTLMFPINNIYIYIETISFLFRGIGIGIATISVLSAPFEYSSDNIKSDTSAISRMVQQLGGAIGASIAVIFSTFNYQLAYFSFALYTLICCIFIFINIKIIKNL